MADVGDWKKHIWDHLKGMLNIRLMGIGLSFWEVHWDWGPGPGTKACTACTDNFPMPIREILLVKNFITSMSHSSHESSRQPLQNQLSKRTLSWTAFNSFFFASSLASAAAFASWTSQCAVVISECLYIPLSKNGRTKVIQGHKIPTHKKWRTQCQCHKPSPNYWVSHSTVTNLTFWPRTKLNVRDWILRICRVGMATSCVTKRGETKHRYRRLNTVWSNFRIYIKDVFTVCNHSSHLRKEFVIKYVMS